MFVTERKKGLGREIKKRKDEQVWTDKKIKRHLTSEREKD